MPDLGNAYVNIIPSAQGISGSISKLLGGEAESAGNSAGTSLGGNLISKLKAVIASAGIAKFLKASLDAGGAIQQSFGGVETLYDGASDAVKKYANEAYKAGISANSYAEQAVSFGAALKQAYGGDTVAAAEAANTAIMDMADNSAKMGTNLQSIQDAYQGFAKQNYTMLDNLKLGYGGTKTEMERLLADANEINAAQGKITDYSIDNLGDVYEAIHVIQGDLKLSGTAAKEAQTTFTGSFGAMKASAENFMATLSNGGDISASLQEMVNSAVTFIGGNLLPMIGNILVQLPQAIFTAVQTYGPQLAASGVEMMNNLAAGLVTGIPNFLSNILPMVQSFCAGLREHVGELVDAGLNMILNLAQGIANSFPVLIETVPQIITDICGIINDNMPKILMAGFQIIVILAKGIIQSIPTLLQCLPQIFQACLAVWQALNWVQLGKKLIDLISSGVKSLFSKIPDLLKSVGQKAWEAFKNNSWVQLGSDIISGIGSGITNAVRGLVGAAIDACKSLVDGVKSFFGIHSPSKLMADEVGKFIPAGIAVGIEDNMGLVQDAMTDVNTQLRGQVNGTYSADGASFAGMTQNITINAPTDLDPSEIARQTRNSTRELLLSLRGV